MHFTWIFCFCITVLSKNKFVFKIKISAVVMFEYVFVLQLFNFKIFKLKSFHIHNIFKICLHKKSLHYLKLNNLETNLRSRLTILYWSLSNVKNTFPWHIWISNLEKMMLFSGESIYPAKMKWIGNVWQIIRVEHMSSFIFTDPFHVPVFLAHKIPI